VNVLLIGGGGREHALGWKLVQDPSVTLTSLPGNPGLASLGGVVEGISSTDIGAVAAMAADRSFDLVVVGPEAPLAAGLVDALDRVRVPVFGPTRAAAQLEASKAFAKDIMRDAGVPTAGWATFDDRDAAIAHLGESSGPYVVKADGLAAGKGVLVTDDLEAAKTWAHTCLDGAFGEAGAQIVIEDFLDGPELSVFAVCDGTEAIPLAPARDYKRAYDGDTGPNTGGMGSYSPVPDLPTGIVAYTMDHVVGPVLSTMAERGTPYRGFLYTGFVLTRDGPRVLEFNCRLGDPETQAVLPRLDGSLVELLTAAVDGGLADVMPRWLDTSAVNVVMAAQGYPESPRTGDAIRGSLDPETDSIVFQAGTRTTSDGLVTAGGRILNVVGTGPDLPSARKNAYDRVATISWPGAQYRTDIAGVS
jgi:phosphoribosylamine--glycine ligase